MGIETRDCFDSHFWRYGNSDGNEDAAKVIPRGMGLAAV